MKSVNDEKLTTGDRIKLAARCIMDIIEYWIIEIVILVFIFCVILFAYYAVKDSAAEKAHFMQLCQQEEPEYKCIAMWRAGEKKSSVVPMPIIIPSGR